MSLEFSTLVLPADMKSVDEFLGVVSSCFCVYSSAWAAFGMTVTCMAIELFDDFFAVCENSPWFSDRFAVND